MYPFSLYGRLCLFTSKTSRTAPKGPVHATGYRANKGEADDSAHGRLPDGACIPVHWRVYLSCKPNIQLASWARLEWSANASFSFLRTIRGLRWRGWPPV